MDQPGENNSQYKQTNWQKFLKRFAEQHNCSYSVAIAYAGPAYREFCKKAGLPQPKVKVVNDPREQPKPKKMKIEKKEKADKPERKEKEGKRSREEDEEIAPPPKKKIKMSVSKTTSNKGEGDIDAIMEKVIKKSVVGVGKYREQKPVTNAGKLKVVKKANSTTNLKSKKGQPVSNISKKEKSVTKKEKAKKEKEEEERGGEEDESMEEEGSHDEEADDDESGDDE